MEPPKHPRLLPFERRYVERAYKYQLGRMATYSPGTPEENERVAYGRGLMGLALLWVVIGIPFIALGVVIELTVGAWFLLAFAAMLACAGVSTLRARQAKPLLVRDRSRSSTKP